MRRLAVAVALVATTGTASAHSSIPGMGNFGGGLLHPLVEPVHLVSLIALALAVGQRGIARMDRPLECFAGALVTGLAAAGLGWPLDTDLALLGLALIAGLAVAIASPRVPDVAYAAVAAFFGLGIGLGSRPELEGAGLVAALVGTAIGSCVALLNAVAVVSTARRPWQNVLVRVVASWVVASAVLVLALALSNRQAPARPSPAGPILHLDTTR